MFWKQARQESNLQLPVLERTPNNAGGAAIVVKHWSAPVSVTQLRSAVHVSAVTDLEHRCCLGVVIDRIDHTIVALTNPILLLPGQLFYPRRSGRGTQGVNLTSDAAANLGR